MKRTILFIALYLSLTSAFAQVSTHTPENADEVAALANKDKVVSFLPASLYFTAGQGESQTLNININNNTDSPVQFRLYLADFERNEEGVVANFAPGSTPQSCARWVSLENNFLKVPANTKGVLEVTMNVPDSASATEEMKWAMLFLEGMNERITKKSGNVTTSVEPTYRVGVQVYQTPPTALAKELKMISFSPKAQRREYRVVCKNEGGVLLRCRSYIELLSKETGEKITVYPEEDGKNLFKLLPGQLRNIEYIIPVTIPAGNYTAIAMVEAADPDVAIEAAQLDVELR